ncbi:MAG: restriction endonuclease subunit S [Candidatus Hodarchaeales archaeon]|jgi:type I restriction enzyme S subunit
MGWSEVEIGSFLKERQDRFKPEEANKKALKRLQKIDFDGNVHIKENSHTRTNMILVRNGDFVISGINAEKGAIALYEGEEDVLATIHYSSYEYDKSRIYIEYFKWLLRSRIFRRLLEEKAGSGIKTEIKPKKLLPLKIPLPDLLDQKLILYRINRVANEISEIKDLNRNTGELIKKLREAILQVAVKGELLPQNPDDEPASELVKCIKAEKQKLIEEGKIKKEKPLPPISDDEIPFELKKGWVWERLGNIVNPVRGITYGVVKLGEDFQNGVKILRSSDVKYRKISTTNIRNISKEVSNQYSRTILKGGELLITIRGTLGGCAIVPQEMAGYNISREVAMIPLSNAICSKYILDVLSSPYIQESTIKNLRGIAYKGLNIGHLKHFLIPVPPRNEQKRIVSKVDALMKPCSRLETQIEQSKQDSEKLLEAVLQEALKIE